MVTFDKFTIQIDTISVHPILICEKLGMGLKSLSKDRVQIMYIDCLELMVQHPFTQYI